METRIGRRLYRVFAMDIESHNDEESIRNQETSCWLGCLLDEQSTLYDEESFFYSIDQLLDKIENLSTQHFTKNKTRICKNLVIYIYNLSFEWSFILPRLLNRGFNFKERIEKDDSFVFTSVSTKSCSSVWQASLKFGKKNGDIILRDLAKLYGGGLGKVAESFGLETQKGKIDYRLNRLHNYIITDEEKEYCFKDTRIIIEILLKMKEKEDKDFWQSQSMASYSMRKLLKTGYPRALRPYQAFRISYPELSAEETDFLRKGVSGGIAYAPERWQFKEVNGKIGHIDAHQMHPSSAYLNLFPYGEGEYFLGEPPLGKISCCRIRITYDDVILHSVISLIGTPFTTDKEITLWDFEIPTLKKCYVNLHIEYLDGYAYKMRPLKWRRYYENNYRMRLKAKKEGDAFLTLYYKLLNNSSYGKLLEKPHNEILENIIREDGVIDSIKHEKGKDELRISARYTYLPVGSAIPAYSRVSLIETAFKIDPTGQKILYFDTDSIFFLWDEETKKAWDKIDQQDHLGGWGWEEMIDKAQFTAPKRYKLSVEGKTSVKAGGINFKDWLKENNFKSMEDVPFEEINIVNSSWRVQRAYRVKGGTLIEFETKEMNVQKKYDSIYRRNIKDGT